MFYATGFCNIVITKCCEIVPVYVFIYLKLCTTNNYGNETQEVAFDMNSDNIVQPGIWIPYLVLLYSCHSIVIL